MSANIDMRPKLAFEPESKASRLRAEFFSPELAFLMEAHDGLSAKIVEEAGFKGIWASGLTMSARPWKKAPRRRLAANGDGFHVKFDSNGDGFHVKFDSNEKEIRCRSIKIRDCPKRWA